MNRSGTPRNNFTKYDQTVFASLLSHYKRWLSIAVLSSLDGVPLSNDGIPQWQALIATMCHATLDTYLTSTVSQSEDASGWCYVRWTTQHILIHYHMLVGLTMDGGVEDTLCRSDCQGTHHIEQTAVQKFPLLPDAWTVCISMQIEM